MLCFTFERNFHFVQSGYTLNKILQNLNFQLNKALGEQSFYFLQFDVIAMAVIYITKLDTHKGAGEVNIKVLLQQTD